MLTECPTTDFINSNYICIKMVKYTYLRNRFRVIHFKRGSIMRGFYRLTISNSNHPEIKMYVLPCLHLLLINLAASPDAKIIKLIFHPLNSDYF